MEGNVLEKVCNERHKNIDEKLKAVDKRLGEHSDKINSVEDAVIVLTEMNKRQEKRGILDKILTVGISILCILVVFVLLALIFGPENATNIIKAIP